MQPPFRARLRLAWRVLVGREDALSVMAALDDDRALDAVASTARRDEALEALLHTPMSATPEVPVTTTPNTRAMKMRYRTPPGGTRRWACFTFFDIESKANPGLVYLRRLRVIQTPWFGIYLHWINEVDTDRVPHDHPWSFTSLILSGNYVEDIYDDPGDISVKGMTSRLWPRWSIHAMPVTKAHRIKRITNNLLTLVLVGRRCRDWMFWTENGPVLWQQGLTRRLGDPDP